MSVAPGQRPSLIVKGLLASLVPHVLLVAVAVEARVAQTLQVA